MKKEINDLLLKMQTGENCIGETANKLLDLLAVSGSLPIKRYDIDFGGNVMAGIEIKGESLNVFGAINGYGDGIDDEKIKITERRQ